MAEARAARPRVLLLESDAGIAHALREVLEALGHEVDRVSAPAEAATALRAGGVSLLVADDVATDHTSGVTTLLEGLDPSRRLGVLLLTSGRRNVPALAPDRAPHLRVATLAKPFAVADFARLVFRLTTGLPVLPRPRSGKEADGRGPVAGGGPVTRRSQLLPSRGEDESST